MTRHAKPRAKKKGGLLMGMRSGVQHMASDKEPTTKRTALIWNIVTVVLVIVTAAILLRRFGVINF
jgi:hypothetical protein